MSSRLESNPSRVSFDPRDADIEEFDQVAESRGLSRAELLRQQVRDVIGQSDDDDLPDDETLRQSYLALLDVVGDGHRIKTDKAESVLAEELRRPKAGVRPLLERLEDRGYIEPRWGVVSVRPRQSSQGD